MRDCFSTRDLLRELEDTMTRIEIIEQTTASLVRTLGLTPSQAEFARTALELVYAKGHADAMKAGNVDLERRLHAMTERVTELIKPSDAELDRQIDLEHENWIAQRDDDYDRNVAARQGSRF